MDPDDKNPPETQGSIARCTPTEVEKLKRIAMSHAPQEIDLARLRDEILNGDYTPDLKSLADRILSDPSAVEQLLAG